MKSTWIELIFLNNHLTSSKTSLPLTVIFIARSLAPPYLTFKIPSPYLN